jgi:hypothetical protein
MQHINSIVNDAFVAQLPGTLLSSYYNYSGEGTE